MEFIYKDILPEIESVLTKRSPSELQSNSVSLQVKDSTFQLSFFKLPRHFSSLTCWLWHTNSKKTISFRSVSQSFGFSGAW